MSSTIVKRVTITVIVMGLGAVILLHLHIQLNKSKIKSIAYTCKYNAAARTRFAEVKSVQLNIVIAGCLFRPIQKRPNQVCLITDGCISSEFNRYHAVTDNH